MNKSSKKDVYYIYAPTYVEWSAGIRVLHYLCEELNSNGFETFMVIHGMGVHPKVSFSSRSPILTKGILNSHSVNNRRQIAIYPETINGNPMNAPYVIRWLLNFPNLLGGNKKFNNETIFAYSESIARSYEKFNGTLPDVLFIPAIKSTEIESALLNTIERNPGLQVVYAQKFRALGGKPDTSYENCREITRFGRAAPKRSETLKLIREAELVHVYENTTVITEALLFGVPVVCHQNQFFNELIAKEELGLDGITWDPNAIQTPNAKMNLERLKISEKAVKLNIQSLFSDLKIDRMPTFGAKGIILPKNGVWTKHSVSRGFQVLTQKGPIVFLRFLKNYMGR